MFAWRSSGGTQSPETSEPMRSEDHHKRDLDKLKIGVGYVKIFLHQPRDALHPHHAHDFEKAKKTKQAQRFDLLKDTCSVKKKIID